MGNSESKRHGAASAGPAQQPAQMQQADQPQRAHHAQQQAQQQQQQQQPQPHLLSPRAAKKHRAGHYTSPLKCAAEDENSDLSAVHANRSPNVRAYPGAQASASKRARAKARGKHKREMETPQQRQQLAQQQQQDRGLCLPPAMEPTAVPMAASALVRHKPHGSVPPIAANAPVVAAAEPGKQSRRGSSSTPTAAADTAPQTRIVHVTASRRNSLNDNANSNADAVAFLPIVRGVPLAQVAAPTITAASIRAPSPTVVRLTVSVSATASSAASSASSSAASSAAPSALPSNSNSAETSPVKPTATSTASSFPASAASTAAAAAAVAASASNNAPPVPPRSSRGRARSMVEPAVASPKKNALARSASICTAVSGPSAAARASVPAAPFGATMSSAPAAVAASAAASRPAMIGRSSSVPPLPAGRGSASSAFIAALSPPRARAPMGLPNSQPLPCFIDSWAWLPPQSADPFTPSKSPSTQVDPLRFPGASRSLLMAMDMATLVAPSLSQLELLWTYVEGLGGGADPASRASAADGPGSGFIARPRLLLFASEVSSKLQHHCVTLLKQRGGGSGGARKWKHVARALAEERPFILPPPAKLAPSSSPKPLSPSLSSHSALTAAAVAAAADCPAHMAHLRSLASFLLRSLDLNGDLRVSRAEFMAAWPGVISALCQKAFEGPPGSGSHGRTRADGVISCSVM